MRRRGVRFESEMGERRGRCVCVCVEGVGVCGSVVGEESVRVGKKLRKGDKCAESGEGGDWEEKDEKLKTQIGCLVQDESACGWPRSSKSQ